jgi:hypothetical protein
MKNRTLDMALTDAGEIMVKRIMQFYDKPRVWRITNKEGYPEYIEFYMPTIEETDDNGKIVQKKIAEIKRISTMPDGTQNIQTSQLNVKGIPDVRVTSGSSLPYAKAQKAQTALTYFNAGAIDDQELLKAVDWPNYQEVLRRMAKLKMEAQQAETNKKAG